MLYWIEHILFIKRVTRHPLHFNSFILGFLMSSFPIYAALKAVVDAYANNQGPDVRFNKLFEEIKQQTKSNPYKYSQFGR